MTEATAARHRMTKEERKAILASSLGTIFEWYNFYLCSSLAAVISKFFQASMSPQ